MDLFKDESKLFFLSFLPDNVAAVILDVIILVK